MTRDLSPITVTLHEYAPAGGYLTTGKSISFRFPKAYFSNTANQAGGPQQGVHLSFHKFTEEPFALTLSDEKGRRRRDLAIQEITKANFGVSLESNRYRDPNALLEDILKPGNSVYFRGEDGKHRTLLDKQYCGFDQFASDAPWGRGFNADKELVPAQDIQARPFNEVRFFARKNSADRYGVFVACVPSTAPGYPWCNTRTDFEGWTAIVRFSGEYLCEFDAVLSQTRKFLSRHVVQRTPRRQE